MQKKNDVTPPDTVEYPRQFKFPTNVKQIGGVSERLKIYIEDYAFTYLAQLKHSGKEREMLAFLVGRQAYAGEEPILLISGIVPSNFSINMDGVECFADEDWEYAESQIKKYFNGLYIVGWVHIQGGYGTYLSASDQKYHSEYFSRKNQVIYLSDPLEKSDCFFTWDEHKKEIVPIEGYFIYYDKNNGMNSFMTDHKKGEIRASDIGNYENQEEMELDEYSDEYSETDPSYIKEREKLINSYRQAQSLRRINEISQQKKVINMLLSLSAVLFLACIVMGIGLVQNGDRIIGVETQLETLKSSYDNLVTQAKDSTYPVFANQNINKDTTTPEILGEGNLIPIMPAPEAKSDTAAITPEANPIYDAIAKAREESENQADANTTEAALPENNTSEPKPEEVKPSETTPQAPKAEAPKAPETTTVSQTSDKPLIPDSYVVETGDTLSFISVKFYGDRGMTKRIMELNNIQDANKIVVGDVIKLPKP